MTELLLRGPAADELIARRRDLGIDTYDEMWDGVYHVTPVGSAEHADLQAGLIGLLRASHRPGTIGVGPINLGDERNYRVPDAAVIDVVHRSLVWVPSALLVGEVLSPEDDTYEKFDHYEAHGVQEILVVDPRRQCVEIWQGQELGGYATVRRSVLLTGRSDDSIWAQILARRKEHCPWPRRERGRRPGESWDCERGEHAQCRERCGCDCHIDKHYRDLGLGVVIPEAERKLLADPDRVARVDAALADPDASVPWI